MMAPRSALFSFSRRALTLSVLLTLGSVLSGCAFWSTSPAPKEKPVFTPVPFEALPQTIETDWSGAFSAFQTGCQTLEKTADWEGVCRAAQTTTLSPEEFFRSEFDAYRVSTTTGKTDGLMTGYYEPLLSGSRTQHGPYQWPLYAVPDDFFSVNLQSLCPTCPNQVVKLQGEQHTLRPYDDRAGIEARKDELKKHVLCYVNDPVDAFFLQIQGSGRVALDDGTLMRVGFADHNAHPYRSLGAHLRDTGELPPSKLSMQSIRAWARQHPDKVQAALNVNPRYVFFAERHDDPTLGPIGAQGVPLTEKASVAVDRHRWKMGMVFFINAHQDEPFLHLAQPVVGQDTGRAIQGVIRFDYFWGFGDKAGSAAGRQKSRAQSWLLMPKGVPPENALVN